MKMKFIVALAVVVLTGCAATGNDYVVGVVPEVSGHPVLGTLSTADRALLGPDTDVNGIRDDVDRDIKAAFPQQPETANKFAVAVTQLMLATSQARDTTADKATEAKAAACLGTQAASNLLAQIANTPARKAAYAAANRTATPSVIQPEC